MTDAFSEAKSTLQSFDAKGTSIQLMDGKLALVNKLNNRLSLITLTDLFAPLKRIGVFLKWRI